MSYEVAYYHTDLFHAFCPRSAKWWLNGADPVIPYDELWEAAVDFAAGITLKEALEKREIPDLLGHARKYIDVVTAYRKNHSYRSPELSPLFTGEEIEVTARAGYQAAFDKHLARRLRNSTG
jgi:hypothetical protein